MFYTTLLTLCDNNNVKLTPLIKLLGISPGAIGNWKDGSTPNGETLVKIADYFNVSVDYLLGREIPPQAETMVSDIDSTSITINRKNSKTIYTVSDITADAVEELLKKLSK